MKDKKRKIKMPNPDIPVPPIMPPPPPWPRYTNLDLAVRALEFAIVLLKREQESQWNK